MFMNMKLGKLTTQQKLEFTLKEITKDKQPHKLKNNDNQRKSARIYR